MSATTYFLSFLVVFTVSGLVGFIGGYICYMKGYKKGLQTDIPIADMKRIEENISSHGTSNNPLTAKPAEIYGNELLADYARRACLMPLADIYHFLQGKQYQELSSRKRVKIVRNLGQKYGVNNMDVLKRIKEVNLMEGCYDHCQ